MSVSTSAVTHCRRRFFSAEGELLQTHTHTVCYKVLTHYTHTHTQGAIPCPSPPPSQGGDPPGPLPHNGGGIAGRLGEGGGGAGGGGRRPCSCGDGQGQHGDGGSSHRLRRQACSAGRDQGHPPWEGGCGRGRVNRKMVLVKRTVSNYHRLY